MTQVLAVCKKFTFHAAHHDEEATDQCGQVHGHTYHLEIEVTGDFNERMLVHGNVLKDVYREIEPFLDHRNLNDTCPYNPTMENVLLWLTDLVDAHIREPAPNVTAIRLRLWETPTMYAETRRIIS